MLIYPYLYLIQLAASASLLALFIISLRASSSGLLSSAETYIVLLARLSTVITYS